MDILGRKKRRAERERIEAEKLAKQQKKEQEKVFREFLAFISDCINKANKSNKFRTMQEGKISDKIGEMTYFTANKGESVCVMVQDKSVYAHLQPIVCQVDIKVVENRIHILWGAYGPSHNYNIQDKEDAKRDIRRHIDTYTLFPK